LFFLSRSHGKWFEPKLLIPLIYKSAFNRIVISIARYKGFSKTIGLRLLRHVKMKILPQNYSAIPSEAKNKFDTRPFSKVNIMECPSTSNAPFIVPSLFSVLVFEDDTVLEPVLTFPEAVLLVPFLSLHLLILIVD